MVRSRLNRVGFTLVELLAVMSIVLVIVLLVAPAANQILRGSKLTQSGDRLVSLLTLARQNALTKNGSVEVRFYQFGDSGVPGESAGNPTSGRFRALQAFSVDDTGACSPLGKQETMSGSIIMDSGNSLSPLLNQDATKGNSFKKTWSQTNPQVSIPLGGVSYNCSSFRFLADGSTDIPMKGGPWFITLHNLTDGDGLSDSNVGPTKQIKNYVTVQIDPISGSLNTYRP